MSPLVDEKERYCLENDLNDKEGNRPQIQSC